MSQEEAIRINIELNKAQQRISSSATIKDCFHHNKDQCVLPIKSAHSLQRQGALKQLEKIVKDNAFLYSHTERVYNGEHDFYDLEQIGRKKASTFNGSCEFHDTHLFSSIENNPEITDVNNGEHCFLHSYRSFAHSYHRKYEEYKLYLSEDPETKELLKKIYGESGIEKVTGYVKMALDDMKKPKKLLDHWIENSIYDELDYLCYEYPYTIPIACAASTSPSYSFFNEPININPDPNYIYSNIITTVIPFSKRSIFILAAFPDEPHGSKYLDEIDNIKPELLQQKFLSYHLMNNAENCYLSPYFYDSKKTDWKKSYCHMLDYVASNKTENMGFNKHFPINYFLRTEDLRLKKKIV